MADDEKQLAAYQAAVDLVVGAGDEIWQTISAFLVTHSIFMGFLLSKELDSTPFDWRPGAFFAATGGMLLCGIWAIAFSRNISYYRLRIAQARQHEPEGSNVLAGAGRDFAEGKEVAQGGEVLRMHWLARRVRAAHVVWALIGLFIAGYLIIWLCNGPWWWILKIIKSLLLGECDNA